MIAPAEILASGKLLAAFLLGVVCGISPAIGIMAGWINSASKSATSEAGEKIDMAPEPPAREPVQLGLL